VRPLSLNLRGLGIQLDHIKTDGFGTSNGHAASIIIDGEGEEEEPMTPRVDKGKGRAEPEPEEPEKVLSPTFLITESDDEDGDVPRMLTPDEEPEEGVVSPTDRSRNWVAEEGEVFRKGTVLLGPEELEGEYDSEDLRRELLEAMVERPPPRAMQDGFAEDVVLELPPASPRVEGLDPQKPSPRPYVRRSRSSSSTTATLDTQNLPSLAERLQETFHTPTSGTSSPVSPAPGTPTRSRSRQGSTDSG